ncbi:hypothetical protein PRIPAC_87849 [Pristionchus pacificus]|uniref:Uncharacterized protein n=1 Tax=Pristionchus pacificus TaxID=54126 RepID=A0A2A6B9D0_PRIPA|nr:hypothetical protein PRIPAC_87849 [Pristionchus pacificus]|eukprot:PDM62478.1 hypothetical protein PRIPAC_51920 [Pristionchus pacificus]
MRTDSRRTVGLLSAFCRVSTELITTYHNQMRFRLSVIGTENKLDLGYCAHLLSLLEAQGAVENADDADELNILLFARLTGTTMQTMNKPMLMPTISSSEYLKIDIGPWAGEEGEIHEEEEEEEDRSQAEAVGGGGGIAGGIGAGGRTGGGGGDNEANDSDNQLKSRDMAPFNEDDPKYYILSVLHVSRANKFDAIGRAYHFIAVPLYYSVEFEIRATVSSFHTCSLTGQRSERKLIGLDAEIDALFAVIFLLGVFHENRNAVFAFQCYLLTHLYDTYLADKQAAARNGKSTKNRPISGLMNLTKSSGIMPLFDESDPNYLDFLGYHISDSAQFHTILLSIYTFILLLRKNNPIKIAGFTLNSVDETDLACMGLLAFGVFTETRLFVIVYQGYQVKHTEKLTSKKTTSTIYRFGNFVSNPFRPEFWSGTATQTMVGLAITSAVHLFFFMLLDLSHIIIFFNFNRYLSEKYTVEGGPFNDNDTKYLTFCGIHIQTFAFVNTLVSYSLLAGFVHQIVFKYHAFDSRFIFQAIVPAAMNMYGYHHDDRNAMLFYVSWRAFYVAMTAGKYASGQGTIIQADHDSSPVFMFISIALLVWHFQACLFYFDYLGDKQRFFVVFEYEVNRLNITDNVCMFLLAYGVFWENRICVICTREPAKLFSYFRNFSQFFLHSTEQWTTEFPSLKIDTRANAAGMISFASLLSVLLRTIIVITVGQWGSYFNGFLCLADWICCFVLLLAIVDDAKFLVAPYLIFEIYVIINSVLEIHRVRTGETYIFNEYPVLVHFIDHNFVHLPKQAYSDDEYFAKQETLVTIVTVIVTIAVVIRMFVNAYFTTVIAHFFYFLHIKNENEQLQEEPNDPLVETTSTTIDLSVICGDLWRMPNEPFDPDATRYRHLGCCDAHVATSVRVVVAASLVALLFKAIASSNMGEWASVLGETTIASFFFEFICISLLSFAIFKERGLLIWPYIVSQVFPVATIVRLSIIINFYIFLANRAKAYYTFHSTRPIEPAATTPTNARQTIFNYQLTLAPRYPRPHPVQIPAQSVPHNQPSSCRIPAMQSNFARNPDEMQHYSGVTSIFNKRRPNRSKIKPFDPNHPRYLHCWCCYAHVSSVIRVVAVLFTLLTVCRAVITFSYGDNVEFNVFATVCDVLGTIVLVLAVFYESCGSVCPICTYGWCQVCNVSGFMFQISKMDPRKQILINYEHFLARRSSSERRYQQRVRYAERNPQAHTSC